MNCQIFSTGLSSALIKDGTLTGEDMTRLTCTLSDLREDTKYSSVLLDSRRAVSISLVRQQCVRLAQLLKQKISDDGTLDGWLEEGHSDPLPEVRAGYTWPGISISPYLRAGTLKPPPPASRRRGLPFGRRMLWRALWPRIPQTLTAGSVCPSSSSDTFRRIRLNRSSLQQEDALGLFATQEVARGAGCGRIQIF